MASTSFPDLKSARMADPCRQAVDLAYEALDRPA
jgi:hypothetical protein